MGDPQLFLGVIRDAGNEVVLDIPREPGGRGVAPLRLRESQRDQAKPLVVFCHPDCWGSWNAAKRAILYGYTDVQWYEEGIEGWQDAGHETQAVQPEIPPE